MKKTIEQLTKREVNTKYGEKEVWNIKFQGSDTWVSSFIGNWNSDWKVGDEIDIENDQIQKTEKGGKTYFNIKAPESARFQGVTKNDFDALESRVSTLEAHLLDKGEITENEEP